MPLGEEGDMWDWGSQQQANLEKATLLMKPIKALSISQTGLPLKLDISGTPKADGSGTMAETKEGESVPRILVPALGADKTPTGPHRATASSNVYGDPPGGASQKGTTTAAKGVNSECFGWSSLRSPGH